MGVRITDAVHFNIEVDGNFMGDSFNSKRGSAVDWQLGALDAGFTFKIGLKKDKEPVEEEPVSAMRTLWWLLPLPSLRILLPRRRLLPWYLPLTAPPMLLRTSRPWRRTYSSS